MAVSLVPALVSILAGAPAAADVETQLARCAAIAESGARLTCFDELAAASTAANAVGGSGWQRETGVNPLDDSPTVVLSLSASEVQGGAGQSRPPQLVLRCTSAVPEVYVVWHGFISLDLLGDGHLVKYRVGTLPAEEDRWTISTAFDATFLPSASVHRFLLESLFAASVVVQTVPYGENPATAVFAVEGLAQRFGQFDAACDVPEWPLPPGRALARDLKSGELRILDVEEVEAIRAGYSRLMAEKVPGTALALAVANHALAGQQAHPITKRELRVLEEGRGLLAEMGQRSSSARARYLNQRLNRFDLAFRRPSTLAAIEAALDVLADAGVAAEVVQIAWVNSTLREAGLAPIEALPEFLREVGPDGAASTR